ncbi:MAG: RecC protein [Parachlamydiales bacterium]|nr:RecC protein [Parachlamydiales bacterium]
MLFVLSHRLDRLVDFLAENLAKKPSLWSESWVLLEGSVNKQWLMVELVKRLPNQAMAGVQFLSWREALQRFAISAGPVLDVFNIELKLAQIFLQETSEALAPITAYLQSKDVGRVSSLARSLSRQMVDAGFDLMHPKALWQKELFEQLIVDGLGRFPEQILSQAIWPREVGSIHCFCTDEMPVSGWTFLLQHAPQTSIYLFSPCRMFWEDIVSDRQRRNLTKHLNQKGIAASSLESLENYLHDTHPLLANWGRLGRETLRRLEQLSAAAIEAYDGAEEDLETAQEKFRSEQLSLLQIVQQEILLLRTPESEPMVRNANDQSIQIAAAGASLLREIQILRDNILSYLQRSHGKSAWSDILVLAPDIRTYEPLIQFVFGPDLPVRIAPVPVLPQSSFLQAFLLLFEIKDRRWQTDFVMELLENSSFQARQKLTPDDVKWFDIWLKEAKVRGVFDEGAGSWIHGMKKMVAGLVYLLDDDAPIERIRSMDWGQAERLDRFLQCIQRIQQHVLALQGESRSLEEWAKLLNRAAQELFEPQDGDDAVFQSFMHKLAAALSHFEKTVFPFAMIQKMLENDAQIATTAYQSMNVEAIQFSSLQPGAVRPAHAIFLIGLDSEHFPRIDMPSSLDWEYAKTLEGDRDRYLILQALMAAQHQLGISYCHLSPEDGKTVEPALIVQELQQVIDAFYPSKTSTLATIHPSLPYDERYFQNGGRLQSFSMEAFRAASAPVVAPSVFWPSQKIAKEKPSSIDLADLMLLARHPWKYFLQRTLGIYIKDENLFSEMRIKDFTLTPYQQQSFLKKVMRMAIDDVLAQYSHLLPPGSFGEWAKVQLKAKAAEWDAHLQTWGIQKQEIGSVRFSREAPPICVPMSDGSTIEIVGVIDLVAPMGLLTAGDLSLANQLRHAPALLALQCLDPSRQTLFSLKKGSAKMIQSADPLRSLGRFVEYAFKAQESLSPLIYPWAEAFLKKGFDDWKQEAQKTLLTEDDAAIQWVLERSQPLPLDRIWDEWKSYLHEAFSDFTPEKEHV